MSYLVDILFVFNPLWDLGDDWFVDRVRASGRLDLGDHVGGANLEV